MIELLLPFQEYEEEDQSAVLAPVPSRPASAGGDEEEFGGHPAPEPYSFSYAVNDEESGAEVSREESQDAAGNIVGKLFINRSSSSLIQGD